nr:hypothetical protein [Streptomyces sp. V2]
MSSHPTGHPPAPAPVRPARLLTQNRELKPLGVWNWSLPAWAGRFPDGTTYNTCSSAGICATVCYARAPTPGDRSAPNTRPTSASSSTTSPAGNRP